MSDDKAADIIARGARAAAILSDDTFKEACARIEADIIGAWKTWKSGDPAGREALWVHLQAHNKIQDVLRDYMTKGRHERQRIEEIAATRPLPYVRSVA